MKKSRWTGVKEKRERPIDTPAGHNREEKLKRAADTLAEEAELLMKEQGIAGIDPEALEEDREVCQMLINSGEVHGAVEGYKYCWVRFKGNGTAVDEKLSWTIGGRVVWEIVKGTMPEARERIVGGEGTIRVIADTLLMRCLASDYEHLAKQAEFIHERRVDSSLQSIEDMADRNRAKVHRFNGEGSEQDVERGQKAKEHAFNFAPQNYQDDLATGRAVLRKTRADVKSGLVGADKFHLQKHGFKQMVAMQIAAKAVEQGIRDGRIKGLD